MILENKTILITGASSGIGFELARQLARKQNRLILIARREKLLQQLLNQLPEGEQQHLHFVCDVADPKQVQDVCDWLIHSEISVDVLLLNAGRSGGFDANNFDLDNFINQIEVNFFGVVYFVKYLLPQFLERKSGLIAVTGSLAGYRGVPNAAPYSASKAALMTFIESLRIDLRRSNITCTLISPGFVTSPMTDKNDFVMPFMISVERAARIILRGLAREKAEIHFPWRLSLPAKFGRILPDNFYAWLMKDSRKRSKTKASNPK